MSSSESKSTVVPEEVDFFKNSRSMSDGILIIIFGNSIPVPFIRDALLNRDINTNSEVSANGSGTKDEETLKGLKILDVGCGAGYLSEALTKLGADVTGIDVVKEAIEAAINHAALDPTMNKIRYSVSSIEDHIQNHKDYYDVVVASEIVEHVDNPESFVEFCVSALKPGGSIIFTTPGKTIFSRLYVILLAEYIFGVFPKGLHSYDKFIAPVELQQILEKNNCKTMQLGGAFYNLLTRTWSASSYTSLFYALHAIKNR